MNAVKSDKLSAQNLLAISSGMLLLVCALYWRTLATNFVYDDWKVLDELNASGIWATLLRHFDPRGLLTFRPLAWVYFAAMFKLFGLVPLAFHIVALVLQAVNGTLVAWLGTKLTGNRIAGIVAGGLFVAMVSLHLDCFLWLVGFFDIGAMTCGLFSIVFFLQDHRKSSAAFMFCAFLVKEAATFLPLLLLLLVLSTRRPLRELVYHAAVVAAYAGVKVLGASPFATNPQSGHAMEASWSVVAARLHEYAGWMAGALLPGVESSFRTGLGVLVVILLLCGWFLARHRLATRVPWSALLLLLGWVLLALMPVLLLKNQSARYYAVHALVPLALLAAIVLVEIATRIAPKRVGVVVGCVLTCVALANVVRIEQMFSLGIRQVIINDGYFHLIKRAAAVAAVRDTLIARRQPLEHGTTVFVEGIPLDALGGNRALRLWFNDTTLSMSEGELPGEHDSSGTKRQVRAVHIDLRGVSASESP